MRIDLLRHGACSGGSIFRGQIDAPLTDEGWKQMSRGLEALAGPWDRIVTSPLHRCQAFATQLGLDKKLPVSSSAGIREIGFGEWEGQPVNKIWTEQQALCDLWSREPDKHSPPSGEPFTSFRSRVLLTMRDLSVRYKGKSLLLITHGGVIKLMLTIANGWSPSQMISLQVGYGFAASMEYDCTSETFAIPYPEQSTYVYRP
ncbi:histidine phosphatase family protein [Microbulbifer sp. 2304DJ12-6]|uniref:histidine phosphatase family protein n=1 Tax=Microbulbifer sp. 2304DJ12-6 TaxID=3233340 RepID=UPI0039B07E5D